MKLNAPNPIIINNEKDFSISNLLNEYEEHKNICVLAGQVQSGKTKWIIDIIKTAFSKFKYDYIFYLSGINTPLFNQSNDRLHIEKQKYHDNLNDIKDEYIGCHVWSVLKEDSWLNNMHKLIKEINNKNKKILIIDDESDYASVNSNNKEPSKIYKLIIDSYDEIINGGILYVTATPWANILNSKTKTLPNMVYTLPINKEYTGLEFFNNKDDFYIVNDSDNYKDQIRFSFCFWLLKTFMFNKEYPNEKSDLLIYLSECTDDHDIYGNYIKHLLQDLKFISDNYSILRHELFNINEQYNLNINFSEFESFIKNNKDNIEEPLIFNFEGKKNNNVMQIYKESDKLMKIIIGGRFLSRGFTYENLLTECFYYVSKNEIAADTVLQRCRWFGYRTCNGKNKINRAKYMNLITSQKIKDVFYELEKLNNTLTENKNGIGIQFTKFEKEVKRIENTIAKNIGGTSYAKK